GVPGRVAGGERCGQPGSDRRGRSTCRPAVVFICPRRAPLGEFAQPAPILLLTVEGGSHARGYLLHCAAAAMREILEGHDAPRASRAPRACVALLHARSRRSHPPLLVALIRHHEPAMSPEAAEREADAALDRSRPREQAWRRRSAH